MQRREAARVREGVAKWQKGGGEGGCMVRGRYAPSPSGRLHVGNLRTALLAWLQVRLQGGRFVLRIEDLDTPRCVEGGMEQVLEDLQWLGIDWDEGPDKEGEYGPYCQSERLRIYDKVFERLREEGLVYGCECSRREIRESVRAPHGRRVVYPGTCRGKDLGEGGRRLAWRYCLEQDGLSFRDGICDKQEVSLRAEVGDYPVRRSDGVYAYQFAVVVDDWLMGITDVVRGEDLLDSTGQQVELHQRLRKLYGRGEERLPTFWHVPLVCDPEGSKMSKRDGSMSRQELERRGKGAQWWVGKLAEDLMGGNGYRELTARELLEVLQGKRKPGDRDGRGEMG